MDNTNYSTQYDRALEQALDDMARTNKYDDCETYVASLERPATTSYKVMPDGTVEFVR